MWRFAGFFCRFAGFFFFFGGVFLIFYRFVFFPAGSQLFSRFLQVCCFGAGLQVYLKKCSRRSSRIFLFGTHDKTWQATSSKSRIYIFIPIYFPVARIKGTFCKKVNFIIFHACGSMQRNCLWFDPCVGNFQRKAFCLFVLKWKELIVFMRHMQQIFTVCQPQSRMFRCVLSLVLHSWR